MSNLSLSLKINPQAIVSYMAMLLYLSLGRFSLSDRTLITIGIGLLFIGATIGAYYKNQTLLGLALVILVIASLISLITISPLEPDLNQEEIDYYKQSENKQIIITSILYIVFLVFFYFVNKVLKFPIKHIVATLILFFGISVMIIYYLKFY